MTNNVNVSDLFDSGKNKNKQESNPQNVKFDAKNYLNTRLEKNEKTKEIKVRIILTQDSDGVYKVAIPVEVHSLKLNGEQNKDFKVTTSGYKSFICLNDKHIDVSDKGCPLCDKIKKLFNEANKFKEENPEHIEQHKALCKQAFSYQTKTAYIVRVIERGHEDEGIKFWRFNHHDDGSGIFDTLQKFALLYQGQEKENIFDYKEGRDIVINLAKSVDANKKEKTTITLMVDTKKTPLADSEEQINEWVNDQKDWRDMYRAKSYDYLQLIADNKTPVFDKKQNKFVAYNDTSETDANVDEHDNTADVNETSQKPLTITKSAMRITPEEDEDLPF